MSGFTSTKSRTNTSGIQVFQCPVCTPESRFDIIPQNKNWVCSRDWHLETPRYSCHLHWPPCVSSPRGLDGHSKCLPASAFLIPMRKSPLNSHSIPLYIHTFPRVNPCISISGFHTDLDCGISDIGDTSRLQLNSLACGRASSAAWAALQHPVLHPSASPGEPGFPLSPVSRLPVLYGGLR